MAGELNIGPGAPAGEARWWNKLVPAGPGGQVHAPSSTPGVADIWAGLTPELGLRLAGMILAGSAVLLAAVLATGVGDSPASPERAAIVLLAGVIVGAGLIVAGLRGASALWMHVVPIAYFALLYFTISNLGEAEPRLVIGYVTVLMWVALFMPQSALLAYSAVVMAILAATWVNHADESTAGIPILIAAILLVSIGTITSLAREHLDRVTHQAALLSGRDPLTGLANLRPLYDQVDLMIQKADREKTALSVLLIELGDFKLVNDRYSRTTGDQTLQEVAKALAGVVRRNELVARRGGAEFALVTETADPAEIESMVERLSGEIAMARLAVCPDGPTAITVGVATCRPGDTVARLLARADQALREAKLGAGGDRVFDDEDL